MALSRGDRLGRYEIVSPLGSGGMGDVYCARDTRLEREVAIKVLPAELASDPDRLRRFEHEARAAAALNHTNILALFDVGEHDGAPYLVTELLEGESLRSRIAHGPLPVKEAVQIAVQVARGLAAAHARGIVHRDLKPENLFVTGDGTVKILDFGLASLRSERDSAGPLTEAATESGLTRAGTVLGTAGYMAPEQVRGLKVDQRADIFAFGCVLYEMLTGRRAFSGNTPADTLGAILRDEPAEVAALCRGIPQPLAELVRRCLEKRPENRFSSAHDLALALQAAVSDVDASIAGAARAFEPRRRGRRVALVGAVAVVVVAGVVAVWTMARRGGGPVVSDTDAKKLMLAVLPMENLSGDPQQEYFSDGMTEELIAQLGRLDPGRLGVIARTSAMHYKHSPKSLAEIGRDLGVQYVLEGSVRREAERVRITAQLIQVQDQTHLWAESFERDLSGILAVQAEVAERVASSLAIELLPERKAVLAREGTTNAAAHEAYLRALFLWNQRGRANLEQAVELFQRAVDLDPGFAPAHAGLADAYSALYGDGWAPADVTMPLAEAAVESALELDPESAEAHATRAAISAYFHWNWPQAEREYQRALELDPGCAKAHFLYGRFLLVMRRYDEAIAELGEAVRLDPVSTRIIGSLGGALSLARRDDEARATLEGAIALSPSSGALRLMLGSVFYVQGRRAEAIAEYSKASELYSGGYRLLYRARALAVEGHAGEARRLLEAVEQQTNEHISPVETAFVALALGDSDGALARLERAVETRDGEAAVLAFHPTLDPLRSNPRFQALLRRMNLPVE